MKEDESNTWEANLHEIKAPIDINANSHGLTNHLDTVMDQDLVLRQTRQMSNTAKRGFCH